MLDHGKRDGVPVTLESTERASPLFPSHSSLLCETNSNSRTHPVGRPLYEKMGFVDFGEILRAKEDPEVEVRPPFLSHRLDGRSLTRRTCSCGL